MLFKQTFKALIRDGSVTMTFRAWKAAKVVVGNSYRLGQDDAIVVEAVPCDTFPGNPGHDDRLSDPFHGGASR